MTEKNANQKGQSVATLTQTQLDSSKSVLFPGRNGQARGLQQFYTTPHIAKFIHRIVSNRGKTIALDLTAGDGSLLAPWKLRYGVEIDAEQIRNATRADRPYKAVHDDVQQVYTLLRLSGARFKSIICNPPFGLTWQHPSLNDNKPQNSQAATMEMALGLLSPGGEGAIIGGLRQLRDIADDQRFAKSVYALLAVPGMFPGVGLECGILFFADPSQRRTDAHYNPTSGLEYDESHEIPDGLFLATVAGRRIAQDIERARDRAFRYLMTYDQDEHGIADTWRNVTEEADRRAKQREGKRAAFDIQISGGKIEVRLSPIASLGISKDSDYGYQVMAAVQALHGQRDSYFALNTRDWTRLKRMMEKGLLTMHPADVAKVEKGLDDAQADACPMYPLKPQQRLGYVENTETLRCIKSDPYRHFTEGSEYKVTVDSEIAKSERTEVKQNADGEDYELTWTQERKILRIALESDEQYNRTVLRETKEDIEYLLEHFDIPDPGDIASRRPEAMEKAQAILTRIQDEYLTPRGITLKQYQRDDVCRLLVKGGGVLAWEQGLGKCNLPTQTIYANGDIYTMEELFTHKSGRLLGADEDGGEWYAPKHAITVASLDEDTRQIVSAKVGKLYRQKVRELCRRVTLNDGSSIEITQAHKLYNGREWTNSFGEGDTVAVPASLPHGTKEFPLEAVRMMAWQLAEGNEQCRQARITQKTDENLRAWQADAATFTRRTRIETNSEITSDGKGCKVLTTRSQDYKDYLLSHGYPWGTLSADREIPHCIMQGNAEVVREFLRVYFEAEGTASATCLVQCTSASPRMIEQVRMLLRRFGIWARLHTKHKCATNGTRITRKYYDLSIGAESLRKFRDEIGFISDRKNGLLAKSCAKSANGNWNGVPISDIMAQASRESGLSLKALGWRGASFKGNHSRSGLEPVKARLRAILDGSYLAQIEEDANQPYNSQAQRLANALRAMCPAPVEAALAQIELLCVQDVHYATIRSVEWFLHDGYVYDVEVPGPHNFVSGGLLAHNTLGAMLFAIACELRGESSGDTLFITPQDLIPQWKRESVKFFGKELVHITSREQARRIKKEIHEDPFHEPTWYITHYEALALTGTQGTAMVIGGDKTAEARRTAQGVVKLPVRDVSKVLEHEHVPAHWEGDSYVAAKTLTRERVLTTKDLCPRCHNRRKAKYEHVGYNRVPYLPVTVTSRSREDTGTNAGWDTSYCGDRHARPALSLKDWRKKKHGAPVGGGCGYSHVALRLKTMAHELSTAFNRGCIIVDEATKIKGDSLTSLSVRGLRARRKLLMSGTPQKNFVHDLFWLLGWALGFSSVRFPFDYSTGKGKFIRDFCVVEKIGGGGRMKILPEVTNLSILWKLLSGGIIRRRKEQTGEPIVERTFVPITVPFGDAQRVQYATWLKRFADYYCDKRPFADRKMVERNSAILGQLVKLEYATTLPTADPDADYWNVPGLSDWTPKLAKVLELAAKHAAAGQKVLVGSDLMLTGKIVADALNGKGIKASHILEGDGENVRTKDPRKRSSAINAFQNGDTRVLCAGVQSMALGHNLDNAQVVILTGLPWDYASLHQFVARVHRLTSRHPVTIYVVLTAGSMDERKWNLLNDKEASSDLALDGELSEKQQKPVSMQTILNELIAKGMPVDENFQTVAEADCKAMWDAQRFIVKPLLTSTSGPVEVSEPVLAATPKAEPVRAEPKTAPEPVKAAAPEPLSEYTPEPYTQEETRTETEPTPEEVDEVFRELLGDIDPEPVRGYAVSVLVPEAAALVTASQSAMLDDIFAGLF